jgi:ABC-type glycerol-3-phosphate transport system substrate-binding protein
VPPLALPLEGPRGLWIFETIAGKPLWSREAGGLKTNRSLETPIQALQSLLSPRAPELAASDMTWDRAIQDFLDRKSPLLVTTLDALPLIARKAAFGWKAAALPRLSSSHAQPVIGGSDLIVTQDRPEVWKFLMFLYSKEVAGRWTAQGGFVPLRPDWQQTSAWKQAPQEYRALARTAAAAAKAPSSRTTDPEVVRAHTEWVSALRYLFGESSKRLPTETVFTQLDSTLTQR